MGHPGTLPVANEAAIQRVLKVGLALECSIPLQSKFDRKNYFYPDLPKGYQISQYDMPLCKGGKLAVQGRDIQLTRIHLEEDTGRLIHSRGKDYSLVDFNRAGLPLMELVTEPVIQNAKEASQFAQELQLVLRYLGVSDADMEKGQMRVEANISIQKEGVKMLGTKVEVKNLNSFRSVERAIEFEIKRQEQMLESGKDVAQETRGWNDEKGETFPQRGKEEAHDYRYFPEPDIPLLSFQQEEIEALRAQLPELPQQKKQRFQREYGLSEQEADVFVKNRELGQYFEKVISELDSHLAPEALRKLTKLCSNYILTDLQGLLAGSLVSQEGFRITPENFAELIQLIDKGVLASATAKAVLKEMFATGKDPSNIIDEKGLAKMNDTSKIEQMAKEIIQKNPKAASDFKKGKENALQFLLGQLM
ncbi:MAG: Asp-tRNA(Asn)/Glu-tRNA(Gln) amidotransferase subunit GatB, partial [Candidatus Wildermuthbacteria bacterium]|nr:Asp-tRNA(Asn)/Glu-tRNA(Gln) amidotransferase subunit GatB [Candidatus Wildermuthbacteria bacterium]